MAFWGKSLSYQLAPEEIIKPSGGINTYQTTFEISKSECVSNLNVSSRNFPALSVRQGRDVAFLSSSSPSTACNALGSYNGTYAHILNNTKWQYFASSSQGYITLSTQLTNSAGKFIEFNTESSRYLFMTNGTDRYYWTGSSSSAIAASTGSPSTKYYTVDDYRLYALADSVLWCSALGSVTDWTTVDDADSIPITGMIGTGTALVAYNDMVIAFSDRTMHILYGNSPLDFQLMDPIPIGCVSDRSVVVSNGVLYFMDYYRFMAFTGGLPVEVSQKVKYYLENINYTYKDKIVSSKRGKYIYISIPYGSTATTNNYTLEYDTELKVWNIWNIGILDFVEIGEFLYGVDTSGVIWKFHSGTDDNGTAITWEYITGVWNATPARSKKVISDYWMILNLPSSSTLSVYYSTSIDGSDWTLLKTFTGSDDIQNTRVQIPTSYLANIDSYRLKFSGTGPCDIYYIEPYIRVKKR